MAERLLADLAAARLPHPKRDRLSSSVGTATLAAEEEDTDWRHRADRALYAAKAAGRATARAA